MKRTNELKPNLKNYPCACPECKTKTVILRFSIDMEGELAPDTDGTGPTVSPNHCLSTYSNPYLFCTECETEDRDVEHVNKLLSTLYKKENFMLDYSNCTWDGVDEVYEG
jgi:hypothetical protein